jgi:hypothetical protein
MMPHWKHCIAGAAGLLLLAGSAAAQRAVSARAGMINVAEGDVFFLDERGAAPQRVEPKPNELVSLKDGQTLRTEEGRAELLLTPGAFLRTGEASAIKLHSSRLSSVKIEVLEGSALIDVVELLADNSVIVMLAGAEAELEKAGLYRFDAAPPRVRVFSGQAEVRAAGATQKIKSGRELLLEGTKWAVQRFDAGKETDSLYRWSKRRSGYIAMANVSAARQAGALWGTNAFRGGTWLWNPYFGFATYLPWSDMVMGPFGYYYYTPATVYQVYAPPRSAPSFGGGFDRGGPAFAGSMPRRSAESSYTPAAPVSAAAPAAPAAGAGSAGSRGGGAAGGSVGGGGGVRPGSGGRGN